MKVAALLGRSWLSGFHALQNVVNKVVALSLEDLCKISVGMDCSEVKRLVDAPGMEKPFFTISLIMAPADFTFRCIAARIRLLAHVMDSAEHFHPLERTGDAP